MDGSLSATFDRESSRARLGAIIVPLVALLIGLGVGYVVASRDGANGPKSDEVGPTSTKNGVPVGYARTREGAAAAATNFERVRSGPFLAKEKAYRLAISTMAAPDWEREGLDSATRDLANVADRYGLTVDVESSVLRYRVDAFSGDSAQVSVWLVTVFHSEIHHVPESAWSTVTYTLIWLNDDWRVADARAIETTVPRPFQSPTTQDLTNFEKTS